MSWDDVQKMLKAGSYVYSDLFAVIAASYVTKSWPGEPLWILVVGPPGSGKSSCAKLFSESQNLTLISSVTPASLISGWGGDVCDRSLLNGLNDHLLVAKDFGTILSLGWGQRNEIFAILREAYDGHVTKNFGMLRREYWPHFNFIACTTEASERFQAFRSQLGARFLRFTHRPVPLPSPPPVYAQALIPAISSWVMDIGEEPHDLIQPEKEAVGELAKLCAVLRTEVIHDGHSHEVLEVPQFEQPTRLSLQLQKLYGGLLRVMEDEIEALRITRSVAQSIIPPRKVGVLTKILGSEDGLEQMTIADELRLGYSVVRNILMDYYTMGIVGRAMPGYPKRYLWYVTEEYAERLRGFFKEE